MALLKEPSWSGRIGQVPVLLAAGAGLCLITMVVVVVLGVVMRYAFGSPLLGVNEIVQMTAVALAMLALPHCTSSGGHIRVDLFDGILGRAGRFLSDLLFRVLAVVALYFLCRQAWKKAAEAIEFGDVTNMLELPIWPFYGAVFVGMALCALVYALEAFALVVGWKSADD
ncbi:MAG: TRAP transporter small permease [Pseudomonadota bacterium]